jgi:hypothetical protein
MAKHLSELMSFFDQPESIIKQLLAKVFSNTIRADEKRGNSYLIAGLTRGLGVEHIERVKIF